jgi:hypothetical protein
MSPVLNPPAMDLRSGLPPCRPPDGNRAGAPTLQRLRTALPDGHTVFPPWPRCCPSPSKHEARYRATRCWRSRRSPQRCSTGWQSGLSVSWPGATRRSGAWS